MNTSLSIFARALATENLSFSFDATAPTASFDTKTRHLIMPVWDVSETVMTMLVAHEISHALWTPQERSDELFAEAEKQGYNAKMLHRICNVVEDVRIEKLMKRKYPGTRRDFFLGYKEIIDRDMFGFANMDFNAMNIVNRLNIHFKWGVPGFIDIAMTDDERKFAGLIENIETFDDVFVVAKMLYEHPSVQESLKKMEAAEGNGNGNRESNDGEPQESDAGDAISDLSGNLAKKKGEKYTATTVTISRIENLNDCIIDSAEILKYYDDRTAENCYGHKPLNIEEYRKFVRESDAFVRQLVAQFERRKAADEIRRERPKQTGMLNLDRLHQYRTHDDIFLSKIIKQDGKNHGIVFMLDLSGSMGATVEHCFLQVLQLAWFCEKAKIPFEVFGFTDGMWTGHMEQYEIEYKEYMKGKAEDQSFTFKFSKSPKMMNARQNTVRTDNAKLFRLASSKDSASDRERLFAYLYESYVTKERSRVISMSGTPTVECVAMVSQFMESWIADNNIQIPTIMVVTDGDPNGISLVDDTAESMPYLVIEGMMLTVNNEILNTVHKVDTINQVGVNISNAIVGSMLDALAQKFNARRIGMFVGGTSLTESMYANFCVTNREYNDIEKLSNEERYKIRYSGYGESPRFEAAKNAYRDNGVLLLPVNRYPGYDAFFLTKTPKIVRDEDAILDKGNFTKVKNTFVKTMGKRASSRVFLTRYVDIVAGQPIRGQDDSIYKLPWYNLK
jgi:hypothetical protein